MKHSILMGALVLAVALLPSFAAAASTPYNVAEGQRKVYEDLSGTLLNPPTLAQTQGTAAIVDASFDNVAMEWTVEIECFSSSTDFCTGNILH